MLASVPNLPGVMAYGATSDEAIRRVKAIALQVLAEMVDSGDRLPEPLDVLFTASVRGKSESLNRTVERLMAFEPLWSL